MLKRHKHEIKTDEDTSNMYTQSMQTMQINFYIHIYNRTTVLLTES